ncbi:dihydrolipoamide acetyltransferase family protein [Bacillus smithii]|uniref:dihydrolipoamide acetyltransferase family protein n=1 Tax=Bacillus smithii TaxID=1479 RepID=UPI003D25AF2A
MRKAIVLPKLDSSMEEAHIVSWEVKIDDVIKKNDILLIIETEKSSLEVESEVEGILKEIVVDEGETVPVGTILAYVSDETEKMHQYGNFENKSRSVNEEDFSPAKIERVRVSPAARRLARQNGVNLTKIKGSGPKGRVILRDVIRAISDEDKPNIEIENKVIIQKNNTGKRIKLTSMRKTIAERMTASFMKVPQFQIKKRVDVSSVLKLRQALVPSIENSAGVRLTFNDFLIQAVALTLNRFPRVNASFIDYETDPYILEHDDINIGLAVAVDDGLFVPVIHKADQLSLLEIAKKRTELVEKARNGQLKTEEMRGGTFTISNLGSIGVDEFVAIVNPPETCILAVGKIIYQTAITNSGKTEIKPMITLNASFDHRTVDGAYGGKFISALSDQLESDRWNII